MLLRFRPPVFGNFHPESGHLKNTVQLLRFCFDDCCLHKRNHKQPARASCQLLLPCPCVFSLSTATHSGNSNYGCRFEPGRVISPCAIKASRCGMGFPLRLTACQHRLQEFPCQPTLHSISSACFPREAFGSPLPDAFASSAARSRFNVSNLSRICSSERSTGQP